MADLSTEYLSYQTRLIALLESLELSSGGGTVTILPTRLSLINLVKIKLDELIPEGEGVVYDLESEPNVSDPLDLYINGLLDESAKHILQTAPKHILPITKSTNTATQINSGKTGYVTVPEGFLRLHSFKMTEWERDVNEFITPEDKRYRQQANVYVRGGTAKPVLVMTQRVISNTVTRVFEYYSVNTAHTVEKFLYIGETAAENLDDSLYPALTWMCASMILQNIKETDLAQKALEKVQLCYQNL